MNKDVLAAAWCSHDLAARFSQAMLRARAELGPDGTFAAVSRRAWAIDPVLRVRFGDAVSAGLREMWSSDVLRAEQSARIRRSYTPNLRRLRSDELKKRWADDRAKMLRARAVKVANDGRARF